MAEIEAEQQKPKKRLTLSGLILPLLIGATISSIVVFFIVGYISLTEPPPPPEDDSDDGDNAATKTTTFGFSTRR